MPTCVKTEEGRRFVVNKTLGCHKAYERSQSKELSYLLLGMADYHDRVSDNVGHTLLQCDYNSLPPC